MMRAGWLRCVAVLVAVVVLAAACGGEPEAQSGLEAETQPEPAVAPEAEGAAAPPTEQESGPGGAAEVSVPAVVSDAVAGLVAAWGDVDPSVPPLGDYDRARVLAAAETLDPDAVCPAVVGPELLEDVVEVLRVEGGCALVEYVALAGRSVPEVREEIFASDPTALAVGIPPRDLVPTAEYDPADYGLAPPREYAGDEYEAGDWWYLDAVGAAKLWQPDGWEYPTSSGSTRRVAGWSEDVTIAVLDTGTAEHRDLVGSFADTSGDAWLSLECHHDSPDSHGTHVAGLIAARPNNAMDTAGIAPQAKILPIHLLNDYDPSAPCPPKAADLQTSEGETSGVLTATQAVRLAAEAGADIVNMSFAWGYVSSPAKRKSDGSDAFEAMIDLLKGKYGTVFVASAGNCGNPSDFTSATTTRGCPDGLNTESYPAAYDLVYGVGAVNRANDRAVFSTVNFHVDFAMPGDGASNYSGLLSTVPLVSCNPEDTDNDGTTDQWAPRGCGDSANPQACGAATPRRRRASHTPATCAHRVAHFPGTSMAAPLMSGAFAHILARYPDATAEQVVEALLGAMVNPDSGATHTLTDEYGFGVLDPVAALEYLNDLVAGPGELPRTISDIGVELAAGADAQGAPGPDGAPCTSVDCRYVEITLTDAPDGDYTVECYSSANPNQPWHTATWHWPNNNQWTQGGCAYDTPGHQIWITITNPDGTLTTNPITWPTTTQPPSASDTYTAITASQHHFCALRSDGVVACWGPNDNGQAAPPGGTFAAVSAGASHTCGLRTDGTITCWGWNGLGPANPPTGTFAAVTAGGEHSCGLRTDGTITCWVIEFSESFYQAPAGSFTDVAAGHWHVCALRTNGTVTCWGRRNDSGQLNAPGDTFSSIAAGGTHSCGIRADGAVICWGSESDAPGDAFITVDPGDYHTCGVRRDTTIACWGTRETGQMYAPSSTYIDVASAQNRSCALRTDGTIQCGDSDLNPGVLNIGSASNDTLVAVKFYDGVVALHGAMARHYGVECWSTSGDTPWRTDVWHWPNSPSWSGGCWTELPGEHVWVVVDGVASTARISGTSAWAPPPISEHANFTAIAVGSSFDCGLRTDGTVQCWAIGGPYSPWPPRGFSSTPLPGTYTKIAIVNDRGSISGRVCGLTTAEEVECSAWRHFSETDSLTPGEFTAISASSAYENSCQLQTSGQVECWAGEPAAGEFVALAGGWNSYCGLRLSGEVECWVTDSRSPSPSPSPPQGEFIAITAGTEHTCGLRPSGEVECWGPDYWGRSSPPAGEFTAITAGSLHTCGLRPSGEVECWGYSYEGQSSPPAGQFTKIAASGGHTCGLRPSGGIECWGEGIDEQSWG